MLIPTGLVLASQDAVPGDGTYPIKRSLERVIIIAASLHPSTRSAFYVNFSKRRFKEALVLANTGQDASVSLDELVLQTEEAASSVRNVSDLKTREKLTRDLIKQLEEYDEGLTKLEQKKTVLVITPTPKVTEAPQKVQPVSPTPKPLETPTLEKTGDFTKYRQDLERLRREYEEELRRLRSTPQVSVVSITPSPTPTIFIPTPTEVVPTPTVVFSPTKKPNQKSTDMDYAAPDLEGDLPSKEGSNSGSFPTINTPPESTSDGLIKGVSTTFLNFFFSFLK